MPPDPNPNAPHDRAGPEARWRLTLLGGLHLTDGRAIYTRLPSRAITALLARLALAPHRAHAREELVELLWPGIDLGVGRNRLRQSLSTLRSLLEPPGSAPVAVLQADRLALRLVPGSLRSDVHTFERHVRDRNRAAAIAAYGGELLPGFYDEWILEERSRLEGLRDELGSSRVHERTPTSVDADPAAPVSLPDGAGRHWLPNYVTRLFGTEESVARLRTTVAEHRLVTVLGPGGSGKTRLAIELAHALASALPIRPGDTLPAFENVHFVSLIDCRDRTSLIDALYDTLAAAPPSTGRTVDGLVALLAGHRLLLVLDNFEQLADDAAGVVEELAGRLALLHILVTSRRPLAVDGEREVMVLPLPLPPLGAGVALDELARNPAIALFVDRAQAVRGDFHLGPAQAGVLARLVHALEGMPLAIELAAARIRSVSPSDMLARLTRSPEGSTPRLDLLERRGARSALDPRHASMRAAIAWSWQLLAPEPARLLSALTVFPSSVAAGTVATFWDGPPGAAGDLVDELVQHSLLRFEPGEPEREPGATSGRFALDVPIREFAAAQGTPADAEHWRVRLRHWAVTWSTAPPGGPSIGAMRAELPSLGAALAACATTPTDPTAAADAARIVVALGLQLEAVNLPVEALRLALAAIEHCEDPSLRSLGLGALGVPLLLAGCRDAALHAVTRGLQIAPSEDASLQAAASLALARVRWRVERRAAHVGGLLDRVDALLGPPLDALRPGVDRTTRTRRALQLSLRAAIAGSAGDHALGRRLRGQALGLYEAAGDARAIDDGRYQLASTEQSAGRHAEALALLKQVEAGARSRHDWRRLAQVDNVRGNACCGLRRWHDARRAFHASLAMAWRCMAPYEVAYALWNLPRALAHLRRPVAALETSAFAESFWQAAFGELDAADLRDLERVRRLCARQLDPDAVSTARSRGSALTLTDAVQRALAVSAG